MSQGKTFNVIYERVNGTKSINFYLRPANALKCALCISLYGPSRIRPQETIFLSQTEIRISRFRSVTGEKFFKPDIFTEYTIIDHTGSWAFYKEPYRLHTFGDRGDLKYIRFHACENKLSNDTMMVVKLKSERHTIDPYEMIVTDSKEDDTRLYRINYQ